MLFLPLSLWFPNAIAQQYQVSKCLSGNCSDGLGIAECKSTSPADSIVLYNGHFKNSMPDGEGKLSTRMEVYEGAFEDGKRNGYGIQFRSKKVAGRYEADSSEWVWFCRYDDDGGMQSEDIRPDGSTTFFNREGERKRKNFHPYKEFKDHWIQDHVDAYLDARKAVFARLKVIHDSLYKPQVFVDHHLVIHAQNRINTARGKLERLITWDCTASRKYFVTASNVVRNKLTIMPLGGFVRYQVRDDSDDSVIWEGSADQYWSPKKDGKYRFLIIFDVGQVYGAAPADGAYLEWSLRSETIL